MPAGPTFHNCVLQYVVPNLITTSWPKDLEWGFAAGGMYGK